MIKRKLILIAGHNRAGFKSYPHWRDPGVVKRNNKGKEIDNEHWLMERVALGAYENLKHKYSNIHLLDFSYNLRGKIKWINENCTRYDCVVEIHANASIYKDVSGSEIYYAVNGKRSFWSAKRLAKICSKKMGVKDRGYKPSNFTRHGRLGIIDNTVTYDFLVELGFMTNDKDYEKINKKGVHTVTDICRHLLNNMRNPLLDEEAK